MSEEFVFPSEEWAKEYCRKLNESGDYRSAARTWEGAILFVVSELPEELKEKYGTDMVGFVLDLYHGECRGVKWSLDPYSEDAPFALEASFRVWVEVVTGKLSPVAALMSRRLKLTRGSLATIMRYTTAAFAMVKAAQKVPTKGT